MNCILVGAGAIGASMAAYLSRAEREIIYVDSFADHVKAMRERGLRLISGSEDFNVKVTALLPKELSSYMKEPVDLAFIAVKSQDTREAAELIAPLLSEKGCVVSLQNGINGYAIADYVGEKRVICSFVNWVSDFVSPGVIKLSSLGNFTIGELSGGKTERLEKLRDFLAPFCQVNISDNILRELWSKQINICAMFATGITHLGISGGFDSEDFKETIAAVALEAMKVPERLGIELVSFEDFDPMLYKNEEYLKGLKLTADHYRGLSKDYTGLYRDLAIKKCKSEIDGTVGTVVSVGESMGLALPLNKKLVEMVKEIEEGKRTVCTENLYELKKAYEDFYPEGLFRI